MEKGEIQLLTIIKYRIKSHLKYRFNLSRPVIIKDIQNVTTNTLFIITKPRENSNEPSKNRYFDII